MTCQGPKGLEGKTGNWNRWKLESTEEDSNMNEMDLVHWKKALTLTLTLILILMLT